jgi:FkbM family methyltransferase
MIEALILAMLRRYIRFLRTDKERVGVAERWVRGLLLIVPYSVVEWLLNIRQRYGPPITVDGTSEDGIHLRCQIWDVIQMSVYLFGTWEPDLSAFMRRRLRPGDTFIDVGANVGYLSALGSRLIGPHGIVVAIEPEPATGAALQETVAMNDLTNIRLVAAAVSDRHGELPLFVGPSYWSGFTSTVAPHGSLREQGPRALLREHGSVRAAPLGSLATREELAAARLIKIDVEGAEDRVLAGIVASVDTLPAHAELIVEMIPTWWSDPQLRPIDVLRPFLERGFHVYLLPAEYSSWRKLWPRDVDAPQRLRDLAVLERRERLDVVLSRSDADAL